MTGRFPIEEITPLLACGEHPAKAVVGELVPISGDLLPRWATTRWAATSSGGARTGEPGRSPGCRRASRAATGGTRPSNPTPSAFGASPSRPSRDPYLTWRNAVTKKMEAGQGAKELANDLAIGAHDARPCGQDRAGRAGQGRAYRAERAAGSGPAARGARPFRRSSLADVLWEYPVREQVTTSAPVPIWVDRKRALFSAWYEFFPRSEGAVVDKNGRPVKHGTFTTAAGRLPE